MSQPVRQDELELWAALVLGEKPRYAGRRLGIPDNRLRYICEKWTLKRWYNYGVVYDLGWIEGKGPEAP